MEGWVDLGTAVMVRSPCPRLYIAVAVAKKNNCRRRDSNLGPLTPLPDALTTRLLRPAIERSVRGSDAVIRQITFTTCFTVSVFFIPVEFIFRFTVQMNNTELFNYCIITSWKFVHSANWKCRSWNNNNPNLLHFRRKMRLVELSV